MGKSKKEANVSEDSPKIGKPKREKRRRDEPPAEDVLEEVTTSTEPPKKKPRKNKTGFPDPEDDSSLSEQASKALCYAFTQFRKPSKWKFSKARQNWLIRNIWSDAIPDTYLPLTIQYLSNVKGGVRETLIKECESLLAVPPPAPEKPSAETAPTTQLASTQAATEVAQIIKHARARALLDALETQSEPPK
ncbi:hypothetical protein C8F04DRAFT_1059513 [Mycena alexandri]|uniref:WKF domain-containing protein n=1 Tax=Mycena alexandri TaxID=1745969 RepID=A0AAD6TMJ6_9AGAR|nr:hypothetical protein C8F04DRAFT_1059513 [Mycena alexandri]